MKTYDPIQLSLLVLFCCLVTVMTVPADADVLYVCSSGGTDESPGSEAEPLRSIAAALERAGPGDVIQLMEGVYHETVRFRRSGAAEELIVLRGAQGDSGELLSTIDPGVQLDSEQWQRAEDIGPDVYFYAGDLPFALSQLVIDGKQVASLHHRADHVEGGERGERRYSGWEILGWESDHRVPIPGLDEDLPFWDTIGALYYLAVDSEASYGEKLYFRFADGADPADYAVLIYPAQATIELDDIGHISIQNLNIAASSEGVLISGLRAMDNSVEGCTIYFGTSRIVVTGDASRVRISDNTFQMRFYGTPPGAWAGGGNDAAAAAKRFVYTYYKYWASRYSTSNDRSILLNGSRDVVIENNTMDGGLVGMAVGNSEQVQIVHNTVQNHSSVGISVRNHNAEIYIDSNYFANNSIQFRLHNLNYGWHRGIYVMRNLSVLPESLGTHVFCHVIARLDPISADQSPEAYILHNSFIGGIRGVSLPNAQSVSDGVNDFFIINNLFAVNGPAIHRTISYQRQGLTVGAFDYNLILEPNHTPTTAAPWFGEHMITEIGGKVDEDYLPVSKAQQGAAIDLRELDLLAGRRSDGFSFIADNYYFTESPDIGAIQTSPSTSDDNE